MKAAARRKKRTVAAATAGPPLWMFALAIAAVAWLLYARTLSFEFVWDARAKVLGSSFIHDLANLPDVLTGRVLTRDVLDNNRPGNLLSLMIDAIFWKKNPAGYHATSVTLHAIVCAMLFLLIVRLMEPGSTRVEVVAPAFLAALVFAVHPVNSEPVAEVSYREDLLVACGVLGGLLLATEFLRKPGLLRNLLLGAACCLALLFAVSSKENGVAGPVALASYWLLWRRKENPAPWIGLVLAASILVGGFVLARFTMLPAHSVIITQKPDRLGGPSLMNTLHIQVRIWAVYLRHIIWPAGLCADYSIESLENYPETISAIADALVLAGLLFLATRGRLFALGAIFFLAAMAIVSNFVPMFRPMADRFSYVPLLGGAMLLAEALRRARAVKVFGVAATAVTVAAIPALAIATFEHEAVWRDSISLWRATIIEDPISASAADNLGWALLEAHQPQAAEQAFRRGILVTLKSDPSPWSGLALALEDQGRSSEADAAFLAAAAEDWREWRPEELVRALVIEQPVAIKLEALARRNAQR